VQVHPSTMQELFRSKMAWERPRRCTPFSAWHEHIPLAMFLVEAMKPSVVVELGTYYGDSYCAFCQAVDVLGVDTRCFGVDTWRGDEQTGYFGDEVLEDLRAHHDPLYLAFSTLLQATFDQALEKFEDGTIDLLHIDGLHTYDAIKHDVEGWLPKLSSRGILLLHDTNVIQEDFGVWKYWGELKSRYRTFEFLHGHGLGVLAVGEILDSLAGLFEADEEEAEAYRRVFSFAGARWSSDVARQSSKKEFAKLEQVLEAAVELLPEPAPEAIPEITEPTPPYGPDAAEDVEGYRSWIERQEAVRAQEALRLRREIQRLVNPPLISVLVPVFKPPMAYLRKCIASVRNQLYPNWELCLCDDGSGNPLVAAYLRGLAKADRRVKVRINPENRGISAATNDAFDLSSGDFVTFLDQDDELDSHMLAEVALSLASVSDADLVYCDEDKLDEQGRRFAPYFKPDWSPDLLTSHAYMTHGLVVRRALVESVGRLRSEFDGSQDYDLILRATERARAIPHIPKVLYHWRTIEGSTAKDELAKPWAHEAARAALQSALDRRGEEATAEVGFFRWAFRVRRKIRENPLVSIVIPFRDGADLLARCIESLRARSGYENWEAVLVDNRSWEPETRALLRQLASDSNCRIVKYDAEFNWSAINNWAVSQAKGEIILFLNNDMEGVSEGWLSAMVEHAQRPEVGAVGARLLYPDGRVQHAGVFIGMGAISAHACWFCPPDRNAYFAMDKLVRNYSAVTGACLMLRRSLFEDLGGFDESLSIAYNDIDFCLRLRKRGYLVVYTPFATLVHYESATRGLATDRPEIKIMVERWLNVVKQGDPYYNPNLSLRRFDFGLPAQDETPPWTDLESIPRT
jgi:GT2 family glycosyltransferase